MKQQPRSALRTAVVTGGHAYDVIPFHGLFRALPGVDPYIQHLEDFASSSDDIRDGYDAVVFFFMPRDTPSDQGGPWYAGRQRHCIEHLGASGQGIVLLHHGILAYPDWPLFTEISGLAQRRIDAFEHGVELTMAVKRPDHPITDGLPGLWTMVDETYTTADCLPENEVLIETDHPESMRTIAWIRQHRESRVFCLQSGHDNDTWADPHFRALLANGIRWSLS